MLKEQIFLQIVFISFFISLAQATPNKKPIFDGTQQPSENEFIVVIENGREIDSGTTQSPTEPGQESAPLINQQSWIPYCKTTGLVIGGATVYLIATAIVGGLVWGFFKFVESREP